MIKNIQNVNSPFYNHLLQAVGLLAVIMTIVWIAHFKGGMVWGMTDMGIAWNWHPILMTLSLIFLYGNGKCSILISFRLASSGSNKLRLVMLLIIK